MYDIVVIEGDGIGPEVTKSAMTVLEATNAPITWHLRPAGQSAFETRGDLLPPETLEAIKEHRVVLKGPITTPIASGYRSLNVMLRKKFDLYANVRRIKGQGIDLVIFRENTEGLYIGQERKTPKGAIAEKVVTYEGSKRIIKAAFDYAKDHHKDKVTLVHKANILKLTDGLFLDVARKVSLAYPDITLEEVIIDNMCLQLVTRPQQFQVLVTMNLYGDILSDLCAGLIGGLGLTPGANLGQDMAIFEAVHGSAPDIAGSQKANPIALILSGANLLEYLGEKDKAQSIKAAVAKVLDVGQTLTPDLGGRATTAEMTAAICHALKEGGAHVS